jgi:hypothetical protein
MNPTSIKPENSISAAGADPHRRLTPASRNRNLFITSPPFGSLSKSFFEEAEA